MGSRHTIIHLFPSSSFRGGFFVRILSGFGFVGGVGLLLRPMLLELSLLCGGTGACVRRDGFLCVIWLGSTFFRPDVTDSPLFNSSNTAPMSGAFVPPLGGGGGGGGPPALSKVGRGGGGGGGGPPLAGGGAGEPFVEFESPDLTSRSACAASVPWLFQVTPFGWYSLMYAMSALKSL